MPSLADLFNPSFLMFLGILVLVAALLVVYIESKNREQNHKIQSMFSIVSSLAEEVHNLKLGLSQFSFSGGNNNFNPNNSQNFDEDNNLDKTNKPNILNNISLIPVSDDDNSDSESEESEESEDLDLESVDSYSSSEVLNINDSDEDDKSINLDKNKIKILKINISENFENENSSHDNLEIDEIDEIDEMDELSESESVSSKSNEGVEHLLLLKKIHENENENENENLENSLENINSNILDISSSELKTINISLEDSNNENIDYKKLPLPKLRSIVVEKGLTSDSSKLKKNELLKLLGIE